MTFAAQEPWLPPATSGRDVVDFDLRVSDEQLRDLRERVSRARLPARWDDDDWGLGTSTEYLAELRRYWLEEFDWREVERLINSHQNVITTVDGQPLHALHKRSADPEAMPLLLLHGWPSSFLEFIKVVDPLADGDHTSDATPTCHVVCASLPGYGLSGPTWQRGWHTERIATALTELMDRLGYRQFYVHGTDWGAVVAARMAVGAPGGVLGIHLAMALCSPPGRSEGVTGAVDPADLVGLSTEESRALDGMRWFAQSDGGYAMVHRTRPHSIGPALADSPMGLAAWYAEKYRAWSDCDGDVRKAFTDSEVLAQVSLAWLTGTAESAGRLYFEESDAGLFGNPPKGRVAAPTGVTLYPKEKRRMPRAWVENSYNLVRWSPMPRGGHFAPHETPDLWLSEIRGFLVDVAGQHE